MVAHPAFVRATVVNFFFFAGLNLFVLLPLYIKAHGGTEVEVGLVMGLYSGVGNTTGAVTFGIVAHALGYGPMWSILTAILLFGAVLSVGLAGEGDRVALAR